MQVVDVATGVAGQEQHVAKSRRGHKGDPRAFALQHGVGRDGGAVAKISHVRWLQTGSINGVKRADIWAGGGGRNFGDLHRTIPKCHKIGKGTADFYANTQRHWLPLLQCLETCPRA